MAGAIEFKEEADVRSGEEKTLNAINGAINEELENRFGEKFDRLTDTIPAYRRKARTLLYAYFLRIDIVAKGASTLLIKDQQFIVDRSIHLLQGLLQITTVKQWLSTTCAIMELQQHLLQATYPGDDTIKQLPYITNTMLRRYNRNHKKNKISTVQQLCAMTEDERKSLLKSLTDEEYLDVMEVANRIPKLTIEKAVFKVIGDKIVTTGAIITFILKLRNGEVTSIEATNEKAVEKKAEEEEEDEAIVSPEDEKKKDGRVLPTCSFLSWRKEALLVDLFG